MIIIIPNLPFRAPDAIYNFMEPILYPIYYYTNIFTTVEFILLAVGGFLAFLLALWLALALESRLYPLGK